MQFVYNINVQKHRDGPGQSHIDVRGNAERHGRLFGRWGGGWSTGTFALDAPWTHMWGVKQILSASNIMLEYYGTKVLS